MKVIFLDIDGVLNVIPQGHDEFGAIFHQNFVDNLKWIIDETNAKIVVSSSWRHSGIDAIKQMWKHRNLPGELIDITPNEVDVVNTGAFEFYDLVQRGHEIDLWLSWGREANIDIKYCIIDDDDDMLPEQMNNFVKTADNSDHEDCIDIGYGLTKECARKVIEILNK